MNKKSEEKEQRIKESTFLASRTFEFVIWIFIAFLILLPTFFKLIAYGGIYPEDIPSFFNQLLFAALIILIPILFSIIFGKLPFEYIRSRQSTDPERIKIVNSDNVQIVYHDQKSRKGSNDTEFGNDYVLECIEESRIISEKIYSRSGAYLLVGCLIAFIGVGIFYSPVFGNVQHSTDISQRLLDYLPRFGALFFIEFIAFFFLKQYRIMLEEYRYYEGVKRKRQDNKNLIDLIEKHKDNPEIIKVITEKINHTFSSKLSAGETTQLLETEKLVNSDLDIFEKFTDLVKAIKK